MVESIERLKYVTIVDAITVLKKEKKMAEEKTTKAN